MVTCLERWPCPCNKSVDKWSCLMSCAVCFVQPHKKILCLNQIWREQQEELFLQLEGQEVDLAGDGRCDSPGFSAKYMTYSLHAAQLNKILHFEQVQVGEVSYSYYSSLALLHNQVFLLSKSAQKSSPAPPWRNMLSSNVSRK